ncbi:MAG: hypothetical protein PHO64_04345 [Thiomonas sp.]|nr:hypothetical protein [Thiomonas sp.]
MNAPQEPAVDAAAPTLADIASQYLAAYDGRDDSRPHRIGAWVRLLGERPLVTLSPDDIDSAQARLAQEPARVYGGLDADGKPIFRRKAA